MFVAKMYTSSSAGYNLDCVPTKYIVPGIGFSYIHVCS